MSDTVGRIMPPRFPGWLLTLVLSMLVGCDADQPGSPLHDMLHPGPAQPPVAQASHGPIAPPEDGAQRIAAEQQARAFLEGRGVLVIAEPQTHAVTSVNFRGRPLDEPAAEAVASLFRLVSLDLSQSELGDAQLRHVAGLSSLASLVLSETAVTDEGLSVSFRQA